MARRTTSAARPAGSTWRTMRRSAALSILAAGLVGALLTSCSGSGSSPSSPTGTHESNAIAAAATGYFQNGIGAGNWAEVSQLSTGSLKTAADWLIKQGISTSEEERGSFTINSMSISSVGGSSASLNLNATQTGANYAVTYSGPVSMKKESGGWKVADYLRDGRNAAAAIFPNAHGRASSSGVTVNVVGAQLEAGHVDVWVQISNRTASTLSWDQPIVVDDASGRQLGRGFLFVSSGDTGEAFRMLPHLSAFGDFLVDSATLPLTTSHFRLLTGATDQTSHKQIDLSVPVTLG